MQRRVPFFAVILSALCIPAQGSANSLDYQSFQELFGEPVTRAATGKPQRASESPLNLSVLTEAEISRLPATDLPGLLRHMVGVDVVRFHRGQAEVGVRGHVTPWTSRLLVLVDGRQVFLDSYNYTSWNTIPVQIADIQQVEVVRGPAGALYGFNAVAGVVNIVTRNPAHTGGGGFVEGEVGSHAHRRVSAAVTVPVGRGGLKITGGHRRSQEFGDEDAEIAVFRSAFLPRFRTGDVGLEQNAGSADLSLPLSDTLSVRLNGSILKLDQYEVANSVTAGPAHYENWHMGGLVEWQSPVGLLEAALYHNASDFRQPIVRNTRNPFTVDQTLTVGRVQGVFNPFTAHMVRLAGEYRQSAMVANREWFRTALAFDPPELAAATWSLSAMHEWAATERLTVTAAARLDHLSFNLSGDDRAFGGLIPAPPLWRESDFDDRSIREVSYNFAAVLSLGPGERLRLNAGRALQAPSLIEVGYADPNQGSFGTPDLPPSIVTAGEIGYDRALSVLSATTRIAAFAQRTEAVKTLAIGEVVRRFDPPIARITQQSINTSIGDSDSIGLEASITAAPSPWRWALSYVWQRNMDDFLVTAAQRTAVLPDGRELSNTGLDYEAAQPRHQIRGSIGWSGGTWAGGGWSVDLFGRWHSGYQVGQNIALGTPPSVDIPDTLTLSAVAGWSPGDHLTVQLVAEDLAGGTVREAGLPAARVEPTVTLRVRLRW
ncbi:MAG: hypothetical protein RLY86_3508 [Pseudomonadota bacterium]|jgi:iron complex outermembrane receptor protein